jgi:limonene-1,2-epoxide hydrolase
MVNPEDAIVGDVGPLGVKVLEYERVFRRVAATAKKPGFSQADWSPLAELVAVDEFERVGMWRDVMGWAEYIDMLTEFAKANDFDASGHRIAEAGGRVYFEREERHIKGDAVLAVNVLSVYEFNDQGKIRHLDVYIQGQPAPEGR